MSSNKINLGLLFKTDEAILAFIIESILTYRLSIDTVYELFDIKGLYGVEKEDFSTMLFKKYGHIQEALTYALYIESLDQEECIMKFKKLYDMLMITKNKKLFPEYLAEITDVSAMNTMKKSYGEMTDEEFIEVIKYQLKYALSGIYMAAELNIVRSSYDKRLLKVISNYPDLEKRYKKLAEYQRDIYFQNHKGRV